MPVFRDLSTLREGGYSYTRIVSTGLEEGKTQEYVRLNSVAVVIRHFPRRHVWCGNLRNESWCPTLAQLFWKRGPSLER